MPGLRYTIYRSTVRVGTWVNLLCFRLTCTDDGQYLKQPDDYVPVRSLAKQQHDECASRFP